MDQQGSSGNFFDTGLPSTSTASMSGPGSDFGSFKDQTGRQVFHLQRLVQEIRTTYRLDKEKSESIMNDLGVSRGQAKMIEERLGHLQRMVAAQTDATANLKKDLETKESTDKDQVAAINTEIAGIKTALGNLAAQVEAAQRNTGGAAAALPANIPARRPVPN